MQLIREKKYKKKSKKNYFLSVMGLYVSSSGTCKGTTVSELSSLLSLRTSLAAREDRGPTRLVFANR